MKGFKICLLFVASFAVLSTVFFTKFSENVHAASAYDGVIKTTENVTLNVPDQTNNYGKECTVKSIDLTTTWLNVIKDSGVLYSDVLETAYNNGDKPMALNIGYNPTSHGSYIIVTVGSNELKTLWGSYYDSYKKATVYAKSPGDTMYTYTIQSKAYTNGGTTSSQENCEKFNVTSAVEGSTGYGTMIGNDSPAANIIYSYFINSLVDMNYPVDYDGLVPPSAMTKEIINPTKECSPIDLPCWFSTVFDSMADTFQGLGEAILSGIAYLFSPDTDTFGFQFNELMDFFSEKLGFLFYPIQWILDSLNGLASGITTDGEWGTGICSIPTLNLGLSETSSMSFMGGNISLNWCNALSQKIAVATRVLFPTMLSYTMVMAFRHKIHEIKTKA